MALLGKAGFRPEVLGNVDATDGLRIRDLPDMVISGGLAVFTKKPARIVIRRELSKKDHEYYTFVTNEGGKKLLAYLNERILAGESLGPDDPVIAPDHRYKYGRGNNDGKKFMVTGVIRRIVRETMRPRFKWRPYVLRRYFDTQLLIAESRGKIAHDFRVFFMGHKGSIEAVYTTNKGILPESLVAEMREAFRRSEELLDTEIRKDEEEENEEELKARIEGMAPEQLENVQELLNYVSNGKTESSSSLLPQSKQSSISLGVGATSVCCLTEKSSSKDMFRTDRESGLGGLRSLDLQLRRLPRYPCCASIMTLRYKPLQKLTCRSFKSVIKVSTNQIVYLVPGWTMCLTPSLKIYNIFEFKAWKPVGGLQIRFFCKFIDVP